MDRMPTMNRKGLKMPPKTNEEISMLALQRASIRHLNKNLIDGTPMRVLDERVLFSPDVEKIEVAPINVDKYLKEIRELEGKSIRREENENPSSAIASQHALPANEQTLPLFGESNNLERPLYDIREALFEILKLLKQKLK